MNLFWCLILSLQAIGASQPVTAMMSLGLIPAVSLFLFMGEKMYLKPFSVAVSKEPLLSVLHNK
ncbi:ORF276 [White spot syndrome virus]|uniref:ORF276 n=1 Tax=White spot syndrome virus TaxID=342409 RepID=A0A2D3I6T4_9VIRU|nr:ORF276 [White spot syndrome virus]